MLELCILRAPATTQQTFIVPDSYLTNKLILLTAEAPPGLLVPQGRESKVDVCCT